VWFKVRECAVREAILVVRNFCFEWGVGVWKESILEPVVTARCYIN
jgi:hypothetical protein